jgi:hypothetical protein
MKYYIRIGSGLYGYEVRAKNLKDAKRKARKLCIYGEKIISIYK